MSADDQAGDVLPIDVPKPKKRKPRPGGPVYQGVCAQIRALTTAPAGGEPLVDKRLFAGTIAQARSLAVSIDNVDGREPGKAQANGVPLAAMHEKLDALLARMNPTTNEADPITALAAKWAREDADAAAAAGRQGVLEVRP